MRFSGQARTSLPALSDRFFSRSTFVNVYGQHKGEDHEHGLKTNQRSLATRYHASACAGQRNTKDEESKYGIRFWGMLQSEELGDEYAEEGQGQGGPSQVKSQSNPPFWSTPT
ncbi:MAG: hypothetical protein Q9211_000665 [Gyalolechia sp. 1 TL-2023]